VRAASGWGRHLVSVNDGDALLPPTISTLHYKYSKYRTVQLIPYITSTVCTVQYNQYTTLQVQ
jgi:hypothetical protein